MKTLKILFNIVLFLLGLFLMQILVTYMYRQISILPESKIPDSLKIIASQLIPIIFLIFVKLAPVILAILIWIIIERKPLYQMGLGTEGLIRNIITGSIYGLISTSIIVIILFIFKIIKLEGISIISISFLTGLLLDFTTAIVEEILIRGYITGLLNQYNKIYISLLIPSILFAALHLFNDNFNLLGALNTFLAGVLFTYMTYKTGSLWCAIGFHTFWNWSLINLFNLPVSGYNSKAGIFNFSIYKKSVLGTLPYGPEGGILCTFIIILMIFISYKCLKFKPQINYMSFPNKLN